MPIHYLDEVSSTNDVARKALHDGAAHGTAFRAGLQNSGRGRHGRTWVSSPGNLFLSLVLRPEIEPERLAAVTLAVAVGVRDTLAQFGLKCTLKWPNDLLVSGKKVGGILLEGVFVGNTLLGCVAGIGVNVALEKEQLDEPLLQQATSFRIEGVKPPDLDTLAEALNESVVHWTSRLQTSRGRVLEAWKKENSTLGRRVGYERNGTKKTGRAKDLDANGNLMIDEDGTGPVVVTSGEIHFCPGENTLKKDADLLLVIDVGNTNTVAGVFRRSELLQHWRLQTHAERTADEQGIFFQHLFMASGLKPEQVGSAIMSCVVPPMVSSIEQMVNRYFGCAPLSVGPGIKTGMPILYENPREVGADRVVNAVAAYDRYQQGVIVVDFGTATTFDAVSPKGEYLGGVIVPGVAISADALFRRAAMLPRVDFTRPRQVVGRNTVASMQSGLFYGYLGVVEGIVKRMKAELEFPTKVVATGGLARHMEGETAVIDEYDEHLTLKGLEIIYWRNREP